MTTWDDLKRLRNYKSDVARLQARITSLKDSMYSLQVNMDGMPHAQRKGDKFANYVAELDDMLEKYANKLVAYEKLRTKVDDDLEKLEPLDATIVWLHGVEGKTVTQTTFKVHLSERAVMYRYKRAVEKLSKMKDETLH